MRKAITVKLDEKLYKEMQIIAATLERSVSDLIEEGMRMARIKYAGNQEIIPKLKSEEDST